VLTMQIFKCYCLKSCWYYWCCNRWCQIMLWSMKNCYNVRMFAIALLLFGRVWSMV
jgi:hypothetical protein